MNHSADVPHKRRKIYQHGQEIKHNKETQEEDLMNVDKLETLDNDAVEELSIGTEDKISALQDEIIGIQDEITNLQLHLVEIKEATKKSLEVQLKSVVSSSNK